MPAKSTFLIWQIAFTYVGALVGAGFASGQELVQFFVVFGEKGIGGAVLAGCLFGLLGFLLFRVVSREKIKHFGHLLRFLFGPGMALLVEGLLNIFLLLSLAVMFVAGGSLGHQLWGVPDGWGFGLMAIACALVLLRGWEGVLWLNTFLIPGLIFFTVLIALFSLGGSGLSAPVWASLNLVGGNWCLATALYVAYNFVLAAVVLASLGNIRSREGERGVLLGGFLLAVLAGIVSGALFWQEPRVLQAAMPLLVIAQGLHPWGGWLYSFFLWAAIFTTALGIAFGLLRRWEMIFPGPRLITIVFCLAPTLLFASWSFPQMIRIIYPVIGYVGFLFILVLLGRVLPAEIALQRQKRKY